MREKIEAAGATFMSCDDYDTEQHLNAKDSARVGKDLAFSTKIYRVLLRQITALRCLELEIL